MNSEHFIKYLKNPKLLDEVTYGELSLMREKYPYSHILHYLLFLKSQQSPEDLAEHNKNASIFAVDNNKLFEEIKEFQKLEQKPTEKHTMDDLFDLSDEEDDLKTPTQNEVTPSNDSENAEELTIPINPKQPTEPIIIREQRYIPLDPEIYGDWVKKTASHEKSDSVESTPPIEEVEEKEVANQPEQTNVLFIDALINLDSDNDRIELITNEDAYKEITDTPISEEVNSVPEVVVDDPDVPVIGETLELFESTTLQANDSVVDFPLEVTNEAVIEPDTSTPDILDQINQLQATDFRTESDDGKRETKKSFDNWVRKNDGKDKKKKSKKKKKKDKMPLNAKISIKETDIIASETLAELLVKQGRNKKAIKVYERLCLIFPQKSNYFAQIIKNLKEKS